MGIEPTQPAWKAGILPLNYARNDQVQNGGNRIRTCEGKRHQIYSLALLAA